MKLSIKVYPLGTGREAVWEHEALLQFDAKKSRWTAVHSAIEIPDGRTMGIDVECSEPAKTIHIVFVRDSKLIADFRSHFNGFSRALISVPPRHLISATVISPAMENPPRHERI